MAYSSHKLSFLLFAIFFLHICVHSCNASNIIEIDQPYLGSFCTINTPYPKVCFNSLKNTSRNTNSSINHYLIQSLQVAIFETKELSNLFNNVGPSDITEKQRGTLQDCRELHQSTLTSLKRTLSGIRSSISKNIVDARIYLSAALTNKNTCLEGLNSASGIMKKVLVNRVIKTYKHVSNSLAILSNPEMGAPEDQNNAPLMGDPKWLSSTDQGLFQDIVGEEYNPNEVLVVAKDGTGNFSSITEAINFAPTNSKDKTVIHVKEGIYEENVEIPSNKTNIVMIGDGSDVTIITGNRSNGDGWTPFRSATLAVSGEGFLARDTAFVNSAGPEKNQAVALRVNADLTAFYRCAIDGYQDTLYVHSFRQFYRDCDIYGTIDFIFGNAAVVLQNCSIVSRKPMPGQFTVITAQSRDDPNQTTGISIQNCVITATSDLYSNSDSFKSYLGRPWKVYSRTVYLESFIDDFIDTKGWINWSNERPVDTLYYGEYENYGPGSSTDNRVQWTGYHVMDSDDAKNFTVSEFIIGDFNWLVSTFFPFFEGI